jgi:hypothetical protein
LANTWRLKQSLTSSASLATRSPTTKRPSHSPNCRRVWRFRSRAPAGSTEAWSSDRISCTFRRVSRWLPTLSFSHRWAQTAARLGEVQCRCTPPHWQTPRRPTKTSNLDRRSRLSVECFRETCTGCWLLLCMGETVPIPVTSSLTAAEVCGTTTNGESGIDILQPF